MLMAAGIELPEHVFVHGFLLMQGRHGEPTSKMSKSLGNVLDPFEVIERFGTDALRYYLLPRGLLRPGRLASPRTASRRRYESELANELRQPRQPHARDDRAATATARCPSAEPDPALAARLRRPGRPQVAALMDRVELTQALEVDLAARAAAQPLRRGARAVDSWPRTRGARRRARRRRSPRSPRACAWSRVLLHALHARRTRQAARRPRRPDLDLGCARLGAADGGAAVGRSSRCSRSA